MFAENELCINSELLVPSNLYKESWGIAFFLSKFPNECGEQ